MSLATVIWLVASIQGVEQEERTASCRARLMAGVSAARAAIDGLHVRLSVATAQTNKPDKMLVVSMGWYQWQNAQCYSCTISHSPEAVSDVLFDDAVSELKGSDLSIYWPRKRIYRHQKSIAPTLPARCSANLYSLMTGYAPCVGAFAADTSLGSPIDLLLLLESPGTDVTEVAPGVAVVASYMQRDVVTVVHCKGRPRVVERQWRDGNGLLRQCAMAIGTTATIEWAPHFADKWVIVRGPDLEHRKDGVTTLVCTLEQCTRDAKVIDETQMMRPGMLREDAATGQLEQVIPGGLDYLESTAKALSDYCSQNRREVVWPFVGLSVAAAMSVIYVITISLRKLPIGRFETSSAKGEA